jgi:glycosyltransferase involved in cell wall biosynthesis
VAGRLLIRPMMASREAHASTSHGLGPSRIAYREPSLDLQEVEASAHTLAEARVLYLTNSAQIGGGNRSLLTLWSAMKARGITPLAVCPFEGPMVDACREAGVECYVLPFVQPGWNNPVESIAAHREWSRLLRKVDVDLVHANDPGGARSISFAAWSHRLPVVCHVRFPAARGYMTWAFRFAPTPDVFIFNSQATLTEGADEFQRACPESARRVVHNAVSLADFVPGVAGAARGRAKVGIVANLLPVKGHLDFLEMARLLTGAGIIADYQIIGEDIHRIGYRAMLEATARALGIEDRVTFLGHRSDVSRLVAELDVVVCSSHVEPFGVCLIEAMACERPVVGTRVGGIPEVIEDGVCGFIVPPRSPASLAGAVGALLRQPSLRIKMGRAGRERVRRKFSCEALAAQVMDVYRRLLSPDAVTSPYRRHSSLQRTDDQGVADISRAMG